MILTYAPPSPEALAMLKVLQTAVTKALERKQKLGQYAVIWRDGQPLLIGDDAPQAVEPESP